MRRATLIAVLTLAWMVGPVVRVAGESAPTAPSPAITVSR